MKTKKVSESDLKLSRKDGKKLLNSCACFDPSDMEVSRKDYIQKNIDL